MEYPQLRNAAISGKRVFLRAGFDVPIEDGKVLDTSRIESLVPTMKYILEQGASLVLAAHQGRPKGNPDPAFSQKPLIPVLEELLGTAVQFADSCAGSATKELADNLQPGEVLLLENLRFDAREKENDDEFAQELASFADVYVNDAFTNCHRSHASMVGVPKYIPGYMGLQLEQELEHLLPVFSHPRSPITLIISGAKMETKIPVVEQFLDKGDDILLGGAIANTFVAARGFDVGNSLYEEGYLSKAQELMLLSEKEENAMIHVPRDAVVASEPSSTEKLDLPVEDIEGDMCIFDTGSVTLERYKEVIAKSGTVIWNGPLGLYEQEAFSRGSAVIAEALAEATKRGVVTIIGGGDTLDFHERYGHSLGSYTFVSMGGGAMLELLSGASLPALEALSKSQSVA